MAAATLTTILAARRGQTYDQYPATPRTEEVAGFLRAVVAGAVAITVLAAFLDWRVGPWEVVGGCGIAFTARVLVQGLWRGLAPQREVAERVVVVGTGEEAAELATLIDDHPESRLQLVGVVGDLAMAERCGLKDHWIGPVSRLTDLMTHHRSTAAIVTSTGLRGDEFRQVARSLFEAGHDVRLTTGVIRTGTQRFAVQSLAHEPLVVMRRLRARRVDLWAKRAIDLVGAAAALVATAPLLAITAAAIWIHDRGPVLYAAERIGRDGRPFRMYKFRSMVPDAESLKDELEDRNERTGPLFKLSDDPRVTPIGRFIRDTSIDELPQLLNVLLGHMSLVGPRPALPSEQELFDDELRRRAGVRPGVTGLWQVEARSNGAFNAYRRLDLHYVENWSILMDLRILLATMELVAVSTALLPLRTLAQRLSQSPAPDEQTRAAMRHRPSDRGELAPPATAPTGEPYGLETSHVA